MQRISDFLKKSGKKIGLVPTMGYLHAGHSSLIREAKKICDITVVSVFVNPAQFAPTEDFKAYPRDFQRDIEILEANNVDYLFYPNVNEIYPQNFQSYVEVQKLSNILEGEFRPFHFKGVTTIVSILFNSVKPNFAFFGRKDAQQAAVIKRMVNDLKFDINIVVCPIIREPDGLALSSRNVYLNSNERKDSLVLINTLRMGEDLVKKGERVVKKVSPLLEDNVAKIQSAKLDYIEFVNSGTFKPVEMLEEGNEYYILIACRIGKVRLIDNLIIKI